ncbi:peptidylprolyl isomerase [Micrococcales bacterium KH10]|nr:peptidylprolyl isomerase [Micrococcales bacterium KH10]
MTAVLPEVTGSFGDEPTLTFPAPAAPDGLQVQVLSEGDGEVISVGDAIDVNYHGQIWGGGIFDSSFKRGQSIDFPIGVGMVIKGWDQSLVGKKVGSRVLVSIPPEFGYGSRGVPQAGIGGTDTLVFVVDLLGIKR